MYLQYFGLTEAPFSITPDPAFVYLSAAHREALAHLMYGVGHGGAGGFVQLTGEVGTGKTTLCRCLLEQVPEDCQVALVLNPLMTPRELLATVCEELGIDTAGIGESNKAMVDTLNAYLLEQHAAGQRVVVVIDEAQNLSPEALEQVRLLTNLETAKNKLLQMVLLGQPELRSLLLRQDLRQLAQRITARYHLVPLNEQETAAYVRHRMHVAGAQRSPFRSSALRALYRRSGGVPRLINIVADRALAAAYARECPQVTAHMVNLAANEVQPSEDRVRPRRWPIVAAAAAVAVLVVIAFAVVHPLDWREQPAGVVVEQAGGESHDRIRQSETESSAGSGSAAEQIAATDIAAGDPPLPVGGYREAVARVSPSLTGLEPDWLDRENRMAWESLAELWQEDGDPRALQAACDGAVRTGFACIREQGNWSRIKQLGLPVLLVLRDEGTRLLLLQGMTDDAVWVGGSDAALRVDRDAVEDRWLGEYFVVWPQPPDWPAEIRRGESGRAVDIVMEMAGFAQPAWNGSGIFDEQFETWLMAFQRRNGLRADGIIGPRTLMYLVAPTIDRPRLILDAGEGL